MRQEIRLDKLLCDMGYGTRSEVKKAIQGKKVLVDGVPARRGDIKVCPEIQQISWNGKTVHYESMVYIMMNKPAGVITATEDVRKQTVLDLLSDANTRKDLFPVGRLDQDTEGLLLLTNDGALAHNLLSPKKHVDKTYYVELEEEIAPNAYEWFAGDLEIPQEDGAPAFVARPAVLQICTPTSAYLTISEGKYHQVKRMFARIGNRVTYLKRVQMGSLCLDETLQPGEYRGITPEELAALLQCGCKPEKPDYAKVQAVLFDLDGTLVDSMWMWRRIDEEFLGRYGYECPEDLQRNIEGKSFHETAVYFHENFDIPLSIEELKQCWNEMAYDKYAHEVFLKPGAKEFLQFLKENGIATGIATSNSRFLVETVLQSLGITDSIGAITTGCEVACGKPAPHVYLETAKKLGVDPTKCLVFEDISAGIMAGKNAGMKVCAVEDLYSAQEKQRKMSLADWYITDYRELF